MNFEKFMSGEHEDDHNEEEDYYTGEAAGAANDSIGNHSHHSSQY